MPKAKNLHINSFDDFASIFLDSFLPNLVEKNIYLIFLLKFKFFKISLIFCPTQKKFVATSNLKNH
jgi:hypothetical protein